ncbi:MAG: SufD family Fe-S cluster assembly protein [Clostridia bacterium]|nr:SufD family Fe-S cluster assembly protein [Clostridia bacterium]
MAQNDIRKDLLKKIADLHEVPEGAYNIRENSGLAGRRNTEYITIETKTDKPGINIYVKDGTQNKSVHIPVLITQTGITEMVYNDFFIGEDCDVLIVAGCGIHNEGDEKSAHDGIHSFEIGKNSRVRYIEKHYGEGKGTGERIMNPEMTAHLSEGATLEVESVQIGGIDSTNRKTVITADENAKVLIQERIMSDGKQDVVSDTEVILNGNGSSAQINSRSVAKGESTQLFYPKLTGNADCFGHVQCDSIIMDNAKIRSIPEICANSVDARLVHEAAIGKIAGDQILKLMTLGLTAEEAEEKILAGLLK